MSDRHTTAFAQFCATVAALRHPKTGCPWDLDQTHDSLRRYMIEEAYEAAEVMASPPDSKSLGAELCDELGDVLLQVVLNAQLAADAGRFEIADVIHAIDAKMRRRHPHVFGSSTPKQGKGANQKAEVRSAWEQIKAAERKSVRSSIFAEALERVKTAKHEKYSGLRWPASALASKIGKAARSIKFDWDKPEAVFDKLISEIDELKIEFKKYVKNNPNKKNPKVPGPLIAEIGDVYFTLAQLCRHLDLDPESVAMDGNLKFLRRFAKMEAIAVHRHIDLKSANQALLESLWLEAKNSQSAPKKKRSVRRQR